MYCLEIWSAWITIIGLPLTIIGLFYALTEYKRWTNAVVTEMQHELALDVLICAEKFLRSLVACRSMSLRKRNEGLPTLNGANGKTEDALTNCYFEGIDVQYANFKNRFNEFVDRLVAARVCLPEDDSIPEFEISLDSIVSEIDGKFLTFKVAYKEYTSVCDLNSLKESALLVVASMKELFVFEGEPVSNPESEQLLSQIQNWSQRYIINRSKVR